LRGGETELRSCDFTDNLSQSSGGAVFVDTECMATLVNCKLNGNEATASGGGLSCVADSAVTLENCTVAHNRASESGGAIGCFERSEANLDNCILWVNVAPTGPAIQKDGTSTVNATYSCLQGGWPGAGNIDHDPLFVNDKGPDGAAGTADDDLRLAAGSPSIDAANNDSVLASVSTDLGGQPRFADDPATPDTGPGFPPIADMGAYEYSQDCNENGIPDGAELAAGSGTDCDLNGLLDECEIAAGTSSDLNSNGIPDKCDNIVNVTQGTIHDTIQRAIDAAVTGDRIEVGPATFPENIDLHGKAIHLVSREGPAVTIIDASGNGRGINCDEDEGRDTIIEGFTFANGSAEFGGGMYNYRSSATVINCVFLKNTASNGSGGGMYNDQSDPDLRNCSFIQNTASEDGGGLFNRRSDMSLAECLFHDNMATRDGGGMYNAYGDPILKNCVFRSNEAVEEGGGLYNGYEDSPHLSHCEFDGNVAGIGGGIYSVGRLVLTNCVLKSNNARAGGGIDGSFFLDLRYCNFLHNSANWGGGIALSLAHSAKLTGCLFVDNSAEQSGGGLYALRCVPALTSCEFIGNSALQGGAASLDQAGIDCDNCIFQANSANGDGGGIASRQGDATLTNCIMASNMAEDQGGGIYATSGGRQALINCVVWDNLAPIGSQIFNDMGAASTIVTYSCIEGGWPGDGNIDTDPLFVDPNGVDGTSGTFDDNLRLLPGSPCINTGSPDTSDLAETDLDGHARVLCGRVDMGAYEFGLDDYDCDGDVDLDDFAAWGACMTGFGGAPYGDTCVSFDSEFDGDVDLVDFALFTRRFTGPRRE
jgi:hypothetical protein